MKFLWESNAPWVGTGYGQQTKMILKKLLEYGEEPNCFAFYGLEGNQIMYDGYPVWPKAFQDDGNDVLDLHVRRSEAEIFATLLDVFVLDPKVVAQLPVPWVAWVPIDHEDIGYSTLERLNVCQYPVAMSDFGAQQMRQAGVEPLARIYHCVDTDVFQPMEDKKELREFFGIAPDVYLIGMVMANKGNRKQYPLQLEAVRKWMETHPELDVRVFIHTDPTVSMAGWDMKGVLKRVGLSGKCYSINQYNTSVVPLPPDMMAKLYNSFDVLMNVSSGEGFGIPIIEAQACGVPVITGDYTAMPEITINGYTVKSAARQLVGTYGYQFIPDLDDMVYRLECVYRMNTKDQREAGVRWVQATCGVDNVASGWQELLHHVLTDAQEQQAILMNGSTTSRPSGMTNRTIVEARQALLDEAPEYGTYVNRQPEYAAIYMTMRKLGLRDGDRVLDLGAAHGDLDRFMREQEWHGVYAPVDMVIDGTDLNYYNPPVGFDFIVAEQVIEHLGAWKRFLKRLEDVAGAVIVATPNGEVVDKFEKHDYAKQMAHLHWITPAEMEELGYTVELLTMTGRANDTILAHKVCRTMEDTDESERTPATATVSS